MNEPADDTPILDLLAGMTADSLTASSLDPETLALVRVAALVAVDAPAFSYLMNLEAAAELGIDGDRVGGVLAASRRSSARRGSCPPPARSRRHSLSRSRSSSSRR